MSPCCEREDIALCGAACLGQLVVRCWQRRFSGSHRWWANKAMSLLISLLRPACLHIEKDILHSWRVDDIAYRVQIKAQSNFPPTTEPIVLRFPCSRLGVGCPDFC